MQLKTRHAKYALIGQKVPPLFSHFNVKSEFNLGLNKRGKISDEEFRKFSINSGLANLE